MRILFCTDGSKISFNSLENITYWIKEAKIDTICAIDWSFLPDEVKIEEENFGNSCANVADTILDYAQEKIEELKLIPGLKIKNCGSAIETILEQSKKEKYDLILLGSHGKKGLQKWLGSVSQEIVNSSKISNYISKSENKREKLLVTTDGTSCSAGIIKDILSELNLGGKEIHICMVNDDPNLLFLEGNVDTNIILDIQKQQQIYASQVIGTIKNIFEENGIVVDKTIIMTGNPSQKIIEYVNQNSIDLTIIGSRNKSKLDRFLTGSVSKRILENVNSDVWLARCKEFDLPEE